MLVRPAAASRLLTENDVTGFHVLTEAENVAVTCELTCEGESPSVLHVGAETW